MTESSIQIFDSTTVTTLLIIALLTLPSPFLREYLEGRFGKRALLVESRSTYLLSFAIGAIFGFNHNANAQLESPVGWSIACGAGFMLVIFRIRMFILD